MKKEMKMKIISIIVVVAVAIWISFPLTKKINLGLDLRGGIDIVYELDIEKFIETTINIEVSNLTSLFKEIGIDNDTIKEHVKTKIDGDNSYITCTMPIEKISQKEDGLEKFNSHISTKMQNFIETKKSESNRIFELNKKIMKIKKDDAVFQAIEIIRQRIDEYGVTEPKIVRQGGEDVYEIRVQIPGEKNPDKVIELIGSTAVLEFRVVRRGGPGFDESNIGKLEEDEEIFYGVKDSETGRTSLYVLEKNILLQGDAVEYARMEIDENNAAQIGIEFTQDGASKFYDITSKNINKQLAIVLDDKVQSAPVIQGAIPGGRARITGRFTDDEAKRLAIILRAGSLPAPLKIATQTQVGPTLGSDSIRMGQIAVIIGMILVIVYMLFYYKTLGLFADMALIINLLLILAVLAVLKATLTLPGIAGIVLTVGMAIDANVIIFERIKEELRAGKSVSNSIESGFEKAFSTIFDANLTTLITALVLYIYGTGPVKGFAVTLAIGILASMYTALVCVRIFITAFFHGKKTISI